MYGCNSIPYQTHALSVRNKQIYIGMVAIESLENSKYRKKKISIPIILDLYSKQYLYIRNIAIEILGRF